MVVHFAKAGNASNARAIVAGHLKPGVTELPLLYPVTTEIPASTAPPTAARSANSTTPPPRRSPRHLDAGRTVAVISEGDPLFYGSYMHLHVRLARALSDRHRRRRDRHVGLLVGGRRADRAGRRRAHRAARARCRRPSSSAASPTPTRPW